MLVVATILWATVPLCAGQEIRIGYAAMFTGYSEAAVSMAVDKIQQEGYLTNYSFPIVVRQSYCDVREAVAAQMQLIQNDNCDVVMGHMCSAVCIATGYVDAYFNKPRFPMVCADPDLEDKSSFPTLVRMMPSSDKVGRAFEQIFQEYGWKKVAFLTVSRSLCEYGLRGIKSRFKEINVTVTDTILMDEFEATEAEIRQGLLRMKERTRIMIICSGLWTLIRRIMYVADDLGMASAEYSYFYYELLPFDQNKRPWEDKALNESQTDILKHKRIFSTFKQVTLASLNEEIYDNFSVVFKARFAQEPWTNTRVIFPFSPYAMFLADAMYLYLHIVKDLLDEGRDYRDGRLVFDRARNRIVQGWTGRIAMDDIADREPDFWVWDCPLRVPDCRPYAYLSIGTPRKMDEFIAPYWGTQDGAQPLDTPECGFRSEHCQSQDIWVIVAPVVVAVLLVTLIGALYCRRQKHRERALHMMTWKVDFKDIDFSRAGGAASLGIGSMRSMASLAQSAASVGSSVKSINDQVFTKVGLYSGVPVAVKFINTASVRITRELLVEMKNMKDLVHENINPFIGACIESPNVCILSSYCTKGSLQDVLENDDIKLDWMFKSSLLRDLINGLFYLRGSSLKIHGSLKSSNCLIDSRWVLRLSGFGLANLKEGSLSEGSSDFKKYQSLLWTAPEFLRMSDRGGLVYGTEKGDIYSFAIILQETLYRTAPFFQTLEPKAIVERVRAGGATPFRPSIPPSEGTNAIRSDVLVLMQKCWHEDPINRPSLDEIKRSIKSTNKGKNANIMDNMIRMMEKYASNLEGLVQQRTGELLDEKKKTDMLLHRMLPSSVANLLKVGKTVDPEMYESVTIYFSDIVGFTSLSSSSTPMQVVDLLNDLYTTFDRTIEKYDVYKVETIGDAYMVVSGLPERNGDRHAPEIADMALSLLKKVLTFKIRHRPDTILNLRIGLHTGPCAAGVVGQTMPRYCLFGDTVNMASRMESNGEAQKIHISEQTRTILSSLEQYRCIQRGTIEVKGKGVVTTYWLEMSNTNRQ